MSRGSRERGQIHAGGGQRDSACAVLVGHPQHETDVLRRVVVAKHRRRALVQITQITP